MAEDGAVTVEEWCSASGGLAATTARCNFQCLRCLSQNTPHRELSEPQTAKRQCRFVAVQCPSLHAMRGRKPAAVSRRNTAATLCAVLLCCTALTGRGIEWDRPVAGNLHPTIIHSPMSLYCCCLPVLRRRGGSVIFRLPSFIGCSSVGTIVQPSAAKFVHRAVARDKPTRFAATGASSDAMT